VPRSLFLLLLGLLGLGGCAPEGSRTRTLTERERDSTIAASPLPGAGTVGRAMEIADSAAARRNRPLPGDP
jgi:hypothetical protein